MGNPMIFAFVALWYLMKGMSQQQYVNFSGWLWRPHEIGRRHQRDLWTHQGGVQLHTKPVPQVNAALAIFGFDFEHLVILNYFLSTLQSQVGVRKVGPRKNGNAKALRYGNTTQKYIPNIVYYSNLLFLQYYEMSYGLNVEMHKQTEICKRLDAIIRQVLPFLSAEHQQQVALAVDRAKQITITELNAVMQVNTFLIYPFFNQY